MSTIPQLMAQSVRLSMVRSKHFRRARAMYIREYVGKYYREKYGLVGDQPTNMIFNTIRAMVPNLIMKNGKNDVETEIVEYDTYAYLLAKALDQVDKHIKFKDTLRMGLVDAFFSAGIFKTGLADAFTVVDFGGQFIDQGELFTDWVDFDDFVFDPECKEIRKARWLGDVVRVPRQQLLDNDEFDHDLVAKLPSSNALQARKKVEALTKSELSMSEINELNDFVDVVELFIAGENIKVTMPDPNQLILPEFLSGADFYGPKEGPYDVMSLTQPVPGNPYPIAPVGIYYDLHIMSNRMMTKILNQADRQKDLAIVDPAGQDEAVDMQEAGDGDTVLGNPDSVKVVSFGGQNQVNERMMGNLHQWFNYMAGNPDQIAGTSSTAESATEFQGMQANASVSVEDARGMIRDCASAIKRKHAWYLHNDPFLEVPIAYRKPGGKRVQMTLTPEQRRGDFLDFNFSIRYRSMLALDPAIKSRRLMDFAVRVIPSMINSAMLASQMGLEFNPQQALKDMAEAMDIDEEVIDWFNDPLFVQRMKLMYTLGSKSSGKAKPGMQQNGQPANVQASAPTDQMEFNQNAQVGAAESQAELKGGL